MLYRISHKYNSPSKYVLHCQLQTEDSHYVNIVNECAHCAYNGGVVSSIPVTMNGQITVTEYQRCLAHTNAHSWNELLQYIRGKNIIKKYLKNNIKDKLTIIKNPLNQNREVMFCPLSDAHIVDLDSCEECPHHIHEYDEHYCRQRFISIFELNDEEIIDVVRNDSGHIIRVITMNNNTGKQTMFRFELLPVLGSNIPIIAKNCKNKSMITVVNIKTKVRYKIGTEYIRKNVGKRMIYGFRQYDDNRRSEPEPIIDWCYDLWVLV